MSELEGTPQMQGSARRPKILISGRGRVWCRLPGRSFWPSLSTAPCDAAALVLDDNVFYGYGPGDQLRRWTDTYPHYRFRLHVSEPQRYGVVESTPTAWPCPSRRSRHGRGPTSPSPACTSTTTTSSNRAQAPP